MTPTRRPSRQPELKLRASRSNPNLKSKPLQEIMSFTKKVEKVAPYLQTQAVLTSKTIVNKLTRKIKRNERRRLPPLPINVPLLRTELGEIVFYEPTKTRSSSAASLTTEASNTKKVGLKSCLAEQTQLRTLLCKKRKHL